MGRLKCLPFSRGTQKALPDGICQHNRKQRPEGEQNELALKDSGRFRAMKEWGADPQAVSRGPYLSPAQGKRAPVRCYCPTGTVGPGMVEVMSCWTRTHSPCALCQCTTLTPKHMNEALGSVRLQKLEGLGATLLRKSCAPVLIHILNPWWKWTWKVSWSLREFCIWMETSYNK